MSPTNAQDVITACFGGPDGKWDKTMCKKTTKGWTIHPDSIETAYVPVGDELCEITPPIPPNPKVTRIEFKGKTALDWMPSGNFTLGIVDDKTGIITILECEKGLQLSVRQKEIIEAAIYSALWLEEEQNSLRGKYTPNKGAKPQEAAKYSRQWRKKMTDKT